MFKNTHIIKESSMTHQTKILDRNEYSESKLSLSILNISVGYFRSLKPCIGQCFHEKSAVLKNSQVTAKTTKADPWFTKPSSINE